MSEIYRDTVAGAYHKIGGRTSDVMIVTGAGAPTDGIAGTGVGVLGKGSLYIDSSGGFLYENRNTKASPTWNAIGAISGAEIADGAITTTKIADLNVTGTKIALLAVDTAQIALLAVGTAQIANDAVTNEKLGGISISQDFDSTSVGTIELLPAAISPRTVILMVQTLDVFADAGATQPTFSIGDTSNVARFLATAELTNAAAGIKISGAGIITTAEPLILTAVAATGAATGAIRVTAIAV